MVHVKGLLPPYTPQQNGGAQRENQTTVEKKFEIYSLNRTGKSSIENVSPLEL